MEKKFNYPKPELKERIDLVIKRVHNPNQHLVYCLSNEQVLKLIEKLNTKKSLLTVNGIQEIVRTDFPDWFNEVKKLIIKAEVKIGYNISHIEKAEKIFNEGNELIYCLNSISKEHIREKEGIL